jgi:catechol 2,3-dioxygenase
MPADAANRTSSGRSDQGAPPGAPDAPGYGIAPTGYRLPAGIRLGRVSLQVGDLARSLEYYARVLGLRVVDRSATSAILAAHGDDAPLIELRELAGARPVPRRGRLGLYHFAILLPDRPALGRFLAHLATIGEYAGMSDHYVSEALYLTDPDGLGIEVYADRPREAWRHEGGQLIMATEPLDVSSVVASAGGAPWAGMPAGTTMGHIHLFVDDIARATSFYHAGLGFDKTVWSYPGALFMSAGGYHHHLGTNTWAASAPRAEPGDARLLEWVIDLPSAESLRGAARSLEDAGHAVEWSRDQATVTDPWGTRVRLGLRGTDS